MSMAQHLPRRNRNITLLAILLRGLPRVHRRATREAAFHPMRPPCPPTPVQNTRTPLHHHSRRYTSPRAGAGAVTVGPAVQALGRSRVGTARVTTAGQRHRHRATAMRANRATGIIAPPLRLQGARVRTTVVSARGSMTLPWRSFVWDSSSAQQSCRSASCKPSCMRNACARSTSRCVCYAMDHRRLLWVDGEEGESSTCAECVLCH